MAALAMARPRWWSEETRFAWLAILPALVFFGVFVGFPVGYSFWLSFHEWNMMSATPTWVGLENYAALASDRDFLRSLVQTALFTAGITACILVFSLAMALLLDQKLRFIRLYRAVFYLPAVTSLVAIGIVWVWMFDPQFGLINQSLRGIGVEGPLWLADTRLALVSLVITAAWRNVGYFATVFLAGLQGIDQMYYEAARIDGAGPWDSFWRVTLPLLKPTIVFVAVLAVILSFQVFALVYVMTAGGPAGSTQVLVFYLYQQAFTYFRMGYASAIGFVLFVIVFVLTVLQFKAFGKAVGDLMAGAGNPLTRTALYGVLAACTVVTLLPYAWMLSSSFKPNVEIFSAAVQFVPAQPILDNYTEAVARQPVGRAILNSVIVAGVETLAVVLTSVFVAYPFARMRFPGRDLLFLAILGTMMIPSQATMIPSFMLIKWFGWVDTYQGLIVPRIMSPLGIFLMRQFLQTLPRELDEAARIDGCSRLQTLRLVLLPLMGPAMATLAIFTFTASWNEFFWPLIVVQSNEMRTIQLLIAAMKQAEIADWGVIMAVVTLSVVPTVAVFVLLQRYFVRGIAMSGLKG